MKNDTFIKIIVWTFIFSIAIFLVNVSFFVQKKQNELDEKYIDISLFDNNYKKVQNNYSDINRLNKNSIEEKVNNVEIENVKKKKLEKIINKQKEELLKKEKELVLKSAQRINLFYINKEFKYKINKKIKLYLLVFLKSNDFKNFFEHIKIYLYEKKGDTRGKMSNRSIYIYGVNYLGPKEFISVFTHEFGHFIDLYYLSSHLGYDKSNKFYNISWKGTKTIKGGQTVKDFVSGYSMTNKYEDFAESFTYFVLHNKDFLKKSDKSKFLKQKYLFFSKYVFKNKEFLGTNFSDIKVIKNYYWDITKISINLKKFLNYIKN